ncbi:hypothetical protein ONZ45_g12843 [Pleurotus djamor]|nr:hypothetical protein ONZ45_g12843 [Pleurotus djamor]
MRTFYLSWSFIAFPAILLTSAVAGVLLEDRPRQLPKLTPYIAAASYAGWHSEGPRAFPLDKVPWKKYTVMKYAYAVPTHDGSLDISRSNPSILPDFARKAKENGVIPLISIGGRDGSRFFSNAVNSTENRAKFVKTLVNFVKKYGLAGVDFDWEYPGKEWACSGRSPRNNTDCSDSDSRNFVNLLQELRQDPDGRSFNITATVPSKLYECLGDPVDVLAFSLPLDHITIMNYDFWGLSSPTAGPNSPVYDACAAPANQKGSARTALMDWALHGFPASKIVLGVPAFGNSYKVNPKDAFTSDGQLASYPIFDGTQRGDAWDDPASEDECGKSNGPKGTYSFGGLIEAGFLDSDGTPRGEVVYSFNDCSQTPYLYDKQKQLFVSFDDARSFAAKGAFIKEKGLVGFSMWEAGGDPDNILLDSIRDAVGFR